MAMGSYMDLYAWCRCTTHWGRTGGFDPWPYGPHQRPHGGAAEGAAGARCGVLLQRPQRRGAEGRPKAGRGMAARHGAGAGIDIVVGDHFTFWLIVV